VPTRALTRSRRTDRLGGTEGNEVLTSAVAVVLVVLLVAEGVTIIRMRGLVTVHMFIGMVLIPPVLLKLASTGYRFVRYYTRAPSYREKGPPLLPLRLLAPLLVTATVVVFATGVALLLLGHRSDTLIEVHKVAFIVWGVVFGVHLLAYAGRVVRSLRGRAVPGSGLRGMLVAASVGAGAALAVSLLTTMNGWNGGHFH
jgi:hypothetical protein